MQTGQAFELGQREVLERMAAGAPLPLLLRLIVELVEQQAEGMLCSLLLLDAERGVVRHGAAPSLPAEFVRAIDGSAIGPRAGSCGTAAYRRERVIVSDIANHEYWTDYRAIALPLGLRACWSTPIFSPGHDVLGTFAMYYREPREPTETEMYWVDRATHLASIAIVRERDEQALRLSEERYRQIVDTAYEGVWLLDADGRTVLVNDRTCEMLGYQREELLGRMAFDCLHQDDRERARAAFSRRKDVAREQLEYRLVRKDGSEFWANIAASAVLDGEGRVVGALGMVTDISPRKRAEASERLRAIVYNAVSDVLFYVGVEAGGEFRFQSVNSAFLKITGLTEGQIIGRLVREVIPEPSRELVLDNYRRAIRERRTIVWTEVTRYPAGLKHGEVSISPIFDENERCTSLVGAVHDITEHIEAQEKICAQAEEAKQLELQVMRAQRLESLGTLAGGIAHDFNNILAAIVANASLAQGSLGAEHSAGEFLSEIEAASRRAADLVRQILTFSRKQKPTRSLLELEPVTQEALKLLRSSTPPSIRLETSFEPAPPPVLADATQVHQIIMNLATNAIHAMSPLPGTLSVRVQRTNVAHHAAVGSSVLDGGEYALLTVTDTGQGIDDATLEHIFDPFFTTKEAGKGTGLGLSVVHGIVKAHDGAIDVRSTPGKGSVFSVYLPAAKAKA